MEIARKVKNNPKRFLGVVLEDVPLYQKPERWYIRVFSDTKNRNEGTFGCSLVPKTGMMYIRQNRPFTKLPFCSQSPPAVENSIEVEDAVENRGPYRVFVSRVF